MRIFLYISGLRIRLASLYLAKSCCRVLAGSGMSRPTAILLGTLSIGVLAMPLTLFRGYVREAHILPLSAILGVLLGAPCAGFLLLHLDAPGEIARRIAETEKELARVSKFCRMVVTRRLAKELDAATKHKQQQELLLVELQRDIARLESQSGPLRARLDELQREHELHSQELTVLREACADATQQCEALERARQELVNRRETLAQAPPPVPQARWFYAAEGEQRGPVTLLDLQRFLTSGTIETTALVWRDGMADWRCVMDVQEVYSTIQERTASPKPNGLSARAFASNTASINQRRCPRCAGAGKVKWMHKVQKQRPCRACLGTMALNALGFPSILSFCPKCLGRKVEFYEATEETWTPCPQCSGASRTN